MYILGNLFGFCAFIIWIISFRYNNKNKILKYQIIGDLFNILHYLLIDAKSGYINKIISFFRDNLILIKSKYKFLNYLIYIFFILYLIMIFLSNSIINALPFIACLCYMFFICFNNINLIRYGCIFCDLLWLIYNINVFSISGIFFKIFSIINIILIIEKNKS